jgi:EKC/KEOPS complex subunit PCC1/LAGE3
LPLIKFDSQLKLPFPTAHLARTAQRSLAVDKELSSLVKRSFDVEEESEGQDATVLVVNYAATTNRMLRVAVNGFFESLGVVLHVMEELDLDVIDRPGTEPLDKVQGLDDVKA